MTRKRRKRYKVLQPVTEAPPVPARVLAIVTVVQWGLYCAMAGATVALLLIASLYTNLHIGAAWWLRVWPSSQHLFGATGLDGHQMAHLALRLAGENGLQYGAIGALAGAAWVMVRMLFRRRRTTL